METDVMERKSKAVATKEPLFFKEKEISELTEIVVFRAYDNKRQQPVKISPCQDQDTGKLFTGQGEDGFYESLSEDDRRRLPYTVEPTTVISINDGKALKPGNPVDRENWRWIQIHPYIALTKDAGNSSRTAVYYVENRRAEATKRVDSAKIKDKARYLIQFQLSYEKQLDIAKAIGHPAPKSFSPIELQDYLLSQADAVAAAIVDAADPKKSEDTGALITAHELIKWKIVEKQRGGVFRYGGPDGVFVGYNEQGVSKFLRDTKHQEIVAAMLSLLEDRKRVFDKSPKPENKTVEA